MPATQLLRTDELAGGDVRVVQVGGVEIGVYRHDGRYFAYRNVCPHQGGPVCEGVRMPKVRIELDEERRFRRHDFDGGEMHIVCLWHGWEFRLETGEASCDPKVRLSRYEVFGRDGALYVDL